VARSRVRAAARKALQRQAARQATEVLTRPDERADLVAAGVRSTAVLIADLVVPGSLWWVAPLQFVCEQMSVRVCHQHGLPPERRDDVATYLMAALQEYVHALAGEFDPEHFEAWIAAESKALDREGV